MLASTITCPFCARQYRMKKPIAEGKSLRCSHCGRSFSVATGSPTAATQVDTGTRTRPEIDVAPAPPTAGAGNGVYPAPHLPKAAGVVVLPAGENGHGPTTAAPAPRSIRGAIWAGVIIGSLLVLGVGTVALAIHLKDKKETPAPAQADGSGQPAGPDRSGSPAASPSAGAPVTATGSDDLPLMARKSTPSGQGRDPTPAPDLPPDLRLPDPNAARPGLLIRSSLSAEEQARVNETIDEGVAFLKKRQTANGSWGGTRVGYAALPGLTLLECGVPASDPAVQKAAAYVREHIPQLNDTYDLGLAILFLDKLGEKQDEKRIRSVALRLIAGQSNTGGWTYKAKMLSPKGERDLFLLLDEMRPQTPLDLFVPGSDEAPPGLIAERPSRERPDLVTQQPGQRPLGLFLPKAQSESGSGSTVPIEPRKPKRKPGELSPEAQSTLNNLAPRLRDVPALKTEEGKKALPKNDPAVTDNSNTQFATLGLWAASRHGVPTERALALIGRRFRASQQKDGSWWYHYPSGHMHTPAMTGAGLLGLAVGHGLTGSAAPGNGKRAVKDPAIDRGLKALAEHIGKPLSRKLNRKVRGTRPGINLYFLWSVERVGMMYSLPRIAGKDWYRWGAELLLEAQNSDGSWHAGGYPGSDPILDSSFALLFLKRANLTREISESLEFFVEGKGMRDNR